MDRTILTSLMLSLLCCIFEWLFLRSRRKEQHFLSFFLKGLAALCFCLVGLVLYCAAGKGLPIVRGLFLGLLGDQLLALRKLFPRHHDLWFLAGALAFSLGHVCYLKALLSLGASLLWAIPILLGLLLMSEAFARKAGFAQGKMHLPGLCYIGMEAAMCAAALTLLWTSSGIHSLLFSLGGLFFLVSDNLLCAYSFGRLRTPAVDRALHASYILAQLLIGWSIRFLP